MAVLIDAWKLFVDDFKSQHALSKKRKEYVNLTSKTLDYHLIESITRAAAAQKPGYYSVITFADGARWEFGVREGARPPARQPDEKF